MKDPHDTVTIELPLAPKPTLLYDVCVTWFTGWDKPHLTPHTKWHRGVQGENLTDAGNRALEKHKDVFNPRVSMIWPIHPQPTH